MWRRIEGLINRDSQKLNDKSKQTVSQSLSTPSQPLKAWLPFSGFVVVVLFLILFRVDGQFLQWTVKARDWTGFGQSYDENALEIIEVERENTSKKETTKTTTTTKRLQPAKTLWDWMTLLLAPATLAGLGFWFQYLQEKNKQYKEEADKARDADQQREQALQAYFDRLSELLVDRQLKKLLSQKPVSRLSRALAEKNTTVYSKTKLVTAELETIIDPRGALDIVKARTLSLLKMFEEDIPRKVSVLSFLGDAGLLEQLDLDLIFIRLNGANLKQVNFFACKLGGANLQGTIFIGANLSHANLLGAQLDRADLFRANLSSANLSSANLTRANLQETDLKGANLNGATLLDTNLYNADLKETDLSNARFWNHNLIGVELERARKGAVTSVQSAKNWQEAVYDSAMDALLKSPEMLGKKAKEQNAPP